MNAPVSDPYGQSNYQVRFDWGEPGAAAVARDVEAIVWVDELGGASVPTFEPGPAVVAATLASAESLAAWALARQESLGGRFRIAVVAAGATRPDGSARFAVEDLLAAGAVIDALAEVGIDHNSPDAAAAAAAYTGLRRATRHLLSASGSARAGQLPSFGGAEVVVVRE